MYNTKKLSIQYMLDAKSVQFPTNFKLNILNNFKWLFDLIKCESCNICLFVYLEIKEDKIIIILKKNY